MPVIIALFAFGTVFYLSSWLSTLAFGDILRVRWRMSQIQSFTRSKKGDDVLSQPLFERAIKPLLDSSAKSLGKLAPDKYRNKVRDQLLMAGNPPEMDADRFMVIQGIIGVSPLFFYIVSRVITGSSFTLRIFSFFLYGLLGAAAMSLYLKQMVAKRQKEIQKTLPDALDLLTVSVEAGLGFDLALSRVTEKMEGALSREFARVLQEIRMGKARRDALRGMVERTDVQDLSSFVGAIIQAEQLGIGIAQILRVQSDSMREKRKQRAQEKAMKAPIKMLFPLVMFIFPTLFIVLLGPAFIQIFKTLTGMGG